MMQRIVQFAHPGTEAIPSVGDGVRTPWNGGSHLRKFLRAPGRYVREGRVQEGDLVFWGSGCFKYFLCQQSSRPDLSQLEKGSIILFGSGKKPNIPKDAHFQLDTVFVVGDYIDYDTNDTPNLHDARITPFYRRIAFLPFFGDGGYAGHAGKKDRTASISQCHDYWQKIRTITREHGCVEGIAFNIPGT